MHEPQPQPQPQAPHSHPTQTQPLLFSLFERQSRLCSSSVALIIEDGRSFTYAELDRLASTIAAYIAPLLLHQSQTQPLVAVMMNRDVGIVASILAILKCGAAYVPVDPAFPPDRQAYIIQHAGCPLTILGDDVAVGVADESEAVVVVVSSTASVVRGPPTTTTTTTTTTSLSSVTSTPTLAYVLYTSGSTGKPKGVMVTQAGVVNIVSHFAQTEHLKNTDAGRTLGLTTFCFDISVLELFLPLLHGKTLVLAFSSSQKDPFRLMEIVATFQIDILQATPTTFEMLLAAGWRGSPNINLLIGGEAFRPSLLPLVALTRSVYNVYGPTETTIWSSACQVTAVTGVEGMRPISIGTPISQTDFYLVSENDGKLIEDDEGEGELCIGGVGVAHGYLNAPELTRERFVPCPYAGSSVPGMMYRTGDVVRRSAQGLYYFVRRMDDQVKIDGFRIELAEIEQVYLQQRDAVEQAVALVRNGRLVIYLQLRLRNQQGKQEREVADLHAAAARKLAYYMMPKDTVIVDSFPQTANGKLDRKALPDPDLDLANEEAARRVTSASGAVQLPTLQLPGMEEHVCGVFRSLRGRTPNSNASFAALGVDSLGAVVFLRVLSESVGGVRIRPAEVYAAGVTVRSFSRALHERLAVEAPDALIRLGLPRQCPPPPAESAASAESSQPKSEDTSPWSWEEGFEEAFSDCVASNVRLLEGMRGVFTFLVLYEHFHYESRTDEMSPFFSANTSLFVVFSGLTTSLQLREPPAFKEVVNGDLEGQRGVRARVLLPRSPFRWGAFLMSRAVGIFPILYLALVLNSPWWIHEDANRAHDVWGPEVHLPGVYQTRDSLICTILYVTGFNCWYRPQCRRRGPNNLLYASIIWSIFIFYAFVRVVLRRIQDALLANYHERKGEDITAAASSGLAGIAFRLAYNRPRDWHEALLYAFAWLSLSVTLLSLLLLSSMKNGLHFLPYFVTGVGAASVFESFYYVRYRWRWLRKKMTTSERLSVGYNASVSHAVLSEDAASAFGGNGHCCYWLLGWAWRFLPDAMAISCGIIMSTLTQALRVPPGVEISQMHPRLLNWGQLCGIQLYYTAYGVVALLQEGYARSNLSRAFLESAPVTLLGYISYPMYLFQRAAFDLWAANFIHLAQTGEWKWATYDMAWPGYPNCWSRCAPLWAKVGSLTILTALCWLVQRYFQDSLVSGVFARLVMPAAPTAVRATSTGSRLAAADASENEVDEDGVQMGASSPLLPLPLPPGMN